MLLNHQAILIDRLSQIVIGSHHNLDVTKLVSASMLDTFAISFSKFIIPESLINFNSKTKNFKYIGSNEFVEITDSIDSETLKKQQLFLLRKYAASRLLDKVEMMSTSFDYMSELNVNDILVYEKYKKELVELYSSIKNCNLTEAEKHLELVNQSNRQFLFKKYEMLWRYTDTLNKITNKETLEKWISTFDLETYTVYRI
jgi:DNA mismatch repair ATPase MutS